MVQPHEETRDLVLRARAGSRVAFEALMKSYAALVAATTAAHTARTAELEDLVQETFLTAWRELGNLKKPDSFSPWLCTIARNIARKASAQRARRNEVERSIRDETCPPGEREMLYRKVISEVEQLPEGYREVFLLRYVSQHDCAQIARELGIALGTVTSRLSRGHQLLRQRLRAAAHK